MAQTHPDGVMADAKHLLDFLERGVGMFFDVGLELVRVEFSPVAPTLFRVQYSGLGGGQVTVDGAPTNFKAAGGSTLAPPSLMNLTTRSRRSSV